MSKKLLYYVKYLDTLNIDSISSINLVIQALKCKAVGF